MPAVDTNVLIRLMVRDDPEQTEAAEALISKGAWASVLAVAETIWVLRSVYGHSWSQLAIAVEMLLQIETLSIQDADVVEAALELFRMRPALGFSDCLMLQMAKSCGNLPLFTFDRSLAKCKGAQAL